MLLLMKFSLNSEVINRMEEKVTISNVQVLVDVWHDTKHAFDGWHYTNYSSHCRHKIMFAFEKCWCFWDVPLAFKGCASFCSESVKCLQSAEQVGSLPFNA